MFANPSPQLGDSENNLLSKICQMYSERNASANPSRPMDSDNNLLFKIALNLSSSPSVRDNDNGLLLKIARSLLASAREGDNNVELLKKIGRALNTKSSGNHAPRPCDSENDLLRKWASLVREGA